MGISLDWNVILCFAGGILILYILGKILGAPIKLFFKLLMNSIFGAVILWLINLLGAGIGISIAINPITALITGFFGVPGAIMLLIAKLIFKV